LLKPAIRYHLEGIARSRDGPALARFGSAFLLRLSQLEAQVVKLNTTRTTTTGMKIEGDDDDDQGDEG
jgi:hypothetical protein